MQTCATIWLQMKLMITEYSLPTTWTATSRRKELYTWYYVCVVKPSDTNDNVTTDTQSTFHTKHINVDTWVRSSLVCFVSQVLVVMIHTLHRMAQVCLVRASHVHTWSERISSTVSPPFSSSSSFPHSSSTSCTSFCTSSTTLRAVALRTSPQKKMDSIEDSYLLTWWDQWLWLWDGSLTRTGTWTRNWESGDQGTHLLYWMTHLDERGNDHADVWIWLKWMFVSRSVSLCEIQRVSLSSSSSLERRRPVSTITRSAIWKEAMAFKHSGWQDKTWRQSTEQWRGSSLFRGCVEVHKQRCRKANYVEQKSERNIETWQWPDEDNRRCTWWRKRGIQR